MYFCNIAGESKKAVIQPPKGQLQMKKKWLSCPRGTMPVAAPPSDTMRWGGRTQTLCNAGF